MPAQFTTNNTRRRKKQAKSKAQIAAEEVHAKYLQRLNLSKSSSSGRAPRLGRGGCEFESRLLDQLPPTSDVIPGFCPKKPEMVYSGERKLLGIAAMHKSNLVPVFEADDAKELAKMRR